jgi:hypothetical protein
LSLCVVDSLALPSENRRPSNSIVSDLQPASADDEQSSNSASNDIVVKQELAGDCGIEVEPRRKEVSIDCGFSDALESRQNATVLHHMATAFDAKGSLNSSSSKYVRSDTCSNAAPENRPPPKTGVPSVVLTSCYWSLSALSSSTSVKPHERTRVPLVCCQERNVVEPCRDEIDRGEAAAITQCPSDSFTRESPQAGGSASIVDVRRQDETSPVQAELSSHKNVVCSTADSTVCCSSAESRRYSEPQVLYETAGCEEEGLRRSDSNTASLNVSPGLSRLVAEEAQREELSSHTQRSSAETPSVCSGGDLTQPESSGSVGSTKVDASGDAANDAVRREAAAKVGPEAAGKGNADGCAVSSAADNGEMTADNVMDLESDLAALITKLKQLSFASDPFHSMTQEELDAFEADGKLNGLSRRHAKIFRSTKQIMSIKASIKEHSKTSVHQVTSAEESCPEDDKAVTRRICLDLYMLYLVSLKCGYRAENVFIVLPDELRLRSECGKYISAEGVPFFPLKQAVPASSWFPLLALVRKIDELEIGDTPVTKAQEDRLRRLHELRRQTLANVCCTSEDQKKQVIKRLHRNLTLYRYVWTASSMSL